MKELRKVLLELLGKEVYVNCNFNYLLWDSQKPTIFTCQDFRNVIDLYNNFAMSITIFQPTDINGIPVLRIERY